MLGVSCGLAWSQADGPPVAPGSGLEVSPPGAAPLDPAAGGALEGADVVDPALPTLGPSDEVPMDGALWQGMDGSEVLEEGPEQPEGAEGERGVEVLEAEEGRAVSRGFIEFDARDLNIERWIVLPDEFFSGRDLAMVGPVGVGAGVRLSAMYDDNLFLDDRNPVADVELSLAPQLRLSAGSRVALTLVYEPRFYHYLDGLAERDPDHLLSVRAVADLDKWTLAFSGTYSRLSGTSVEFSRRVDQNLVDARLEGSYAFNAKTRGELGLGFSGAEYDGASRRDEVWVQGGMAWQYSAKTEFGPALRLGVVEREGRNPEEYARLLLRGRWVQDAKWVWEGELGVEGRLSSAGELFVNPAFALSSVWEVRKGTRLSLDAEWSTRSSDSEVGKIVTRVLARATATQQIAGPLDAGAQAGWSYGWYESEAKTAGATREEMYYFATFWVGARLFAGTSATAFALVRRNESTRSSDDFENLQVGIRCTIPF